MMDGTEGVWSGEDEGWLDEEFVRRVLPVARSDRRENKDLFKHLLPGNDWRDDAKFYPVLLELLRSDPVRIIQFDRRMAAAKQWRKSFSVKATRHLGNFLGEELSGPELLDLPESRFPLLSPERALFLIFRQWQNESTRLLKEPNGAEQDVEDPAEVKMDGGALDLESSSDPEAGATDEPGDDWRSLARNLAGRARALERLDFPALVEMRSLLDAIEEAFHIATEAERRAVEETERRAADLERRRTDLLGRLASMEGQEGVTFLREVAERADAGEIGTVEVEAEAVFDLLLAAQELAGRYDMIRKEIAAALAAEEVGRVADLAALQVGAKAAAEEARQRASERVAELPARLGAALLPGLRPEERSAEPPNGVASHSQIAPAAPGVDEPARPDEQPASMIGPSAPGDEPATEADAEVDMTGPNEPDQWGEAGLSAGHEYEPVPDITVEDARDVQNEDPPAATTVAPSDGTSEKVGSVADALEVDDAPARWAAACGIDDLLVIWLQRGQSALAWRLAKLAAQEGFVPGVPAAVLKALAAAPSVARPSDVAGEKLQTILADAMAAVREAESGSDTAVADRTCALAFAALMRPVLFDVGQVARSHLAALDMEGTLAPFAPLASALLGLGPTVQVSAEDLVELAGHRRPPQVPAARERVRDWLDAARMARTVHQPTYRLLHWLLDQNGELGRVFEAVVADRPSAADEAGMLVGRLINDRTAQQDFLAEMEKAMGRPRRDRIDGIARDWFCDSLQEGCEVLRGWMDARGADAAQVDDRARGHLRARLGLIAKAAETLDGASGGGEGLDAVVTEVLSAAVADLRALLAGTARIDRTPRLRDLLDRPLLLVPGGWPDPEDPIVLEGERPDRQARILSALRAPEKISDSPEAAFRARLGAREFLAASELLRVLEEQGLRADLLRNARADFEEGLEVARHAAQDRVDQLALDLSTLLNLELDVPEDIRARLAQLALIRDALAAKSALGQVVLPALDGLRADEVPVDFPDLAQLLAEIDQFREGVRARVRTGQGERLEGLSAKPDLADSARELIARIDEFDPVTLDTMIGQLQSGLPALLPRGVAEDAFDGFFPGFVEAVAGADLHRGDIQKAIERRDRIGPLDFRDADDARARLARSLVETWAGCDNAVAGGTDRVKQTVETLLNLIGFSQIKVTADRELVSWRLRHLRASAELPVAGRWFLPPAFGSKAQAPDGRVHYHLLVARPEVADVDISGYLGQIGREAPCLLLVLGRLDCKRREALAHVLRQDRQVALVLDETLLLHLTQGEGSQMERLFACGMPFGWLQPYITEGANIPPEMFFGRSREIERIVARESGGSLVYGGRQLGKSALLYRVRRREHQPEGPSRAVYLEIKPVGRTLPSDDVWPQLAEELEQAGVLPRTTGRETFRAEVTRWLEGSPDRRLLVMLDEADNFLSAEARSGYRNLLVFKRLMEETGWRFKAVFAGLHNVRRVARAANSPLVQLGEPICVGPLDRTQENLAEARRLAIAPMRAAGFDYDPPELAADILARVNYYPSLVQVFCKAAIENAKSSSGQGPRWRMGRTVLLEGRTAQQIAEGIRYRFQITLDLDPRYDLVAKALALHRLESSDGKAAVLREGLSAKEIAALEPVVEFWPTGFDPPRGSDFEALLDEMVDLGVLGQTERGRYALRNAQVAQMLGSVEEILGGIYEIAAKEPKADYDAGTFHARIAPSDADHRSPFSDRVLAELLDPEWSGLRLVGAMPALWGKDLGARIEELARGVELGARRPTVLRIQGKAEDLRKRMDAHKGGVLLAVLDGSWDERGAAWLASHSAVVAGQVLPIWMVSPDQLPDILRKPEARRVGRLFTPRPWGELMLRHWLEDHGLDALDDGEVRKALLAASGGVPERLAALRRLLTQIAAERGPQRQKKILDWARAHPLRPKDVGLVGEAAAAIAELATWAGTEPLVAADIADVLGDRAEELMRLFEGLGLAEDRGGGHFSLTPLGRLVAP